MGRLKGRGSFRASRRAFVIGVGGRPPETVGAVNARCGEGANRPSHLGSKAPIRGSSRSTRCGPQGDVRTGELGWGSDRGISGGLTQGGKGCAGVLWKTLLQLLGLLEFFGAGIWAFK